LLLPDGQTGEAWKPSKKGLLFPNCAALVRKVLSLFPCIVRRMRCAAAFTTPVWTRRPTGSRALRKITRSVCLCLTLFLKISGERNRGDTRAAFCTPWDQNVQGV